MKSSRLQTAAFIALCVAARAGAFEVKTHIDMNIGAATSADPDGGSLGAILRNELGFEKDLGTKFAEKPILAWIEEGGEREDDFNPVPSLVPGRFLRHFHDPLEPWPEAGLELGGQFESSLVWMQRPQGWSWQETREMYYAALTSNDPLAWANTFRGVGQIMHLVEDAAQPAHVRNDQHAGASVCEHLGYKCLANFETWVLANSATLSFDPADADARFDRDILLQATAQSIAPLPVARLLDMDQYDGTTPMTTLGATIGLAEFTNANFFSEDSVPQFTVGYPFPNVTAVVPSIHPVESGFLRRYYAKGAGDGIALDPAVTASAWNVLFPGTVLGGTTDSNVYAAMAPMLVPKAVDYAQGALHYFFRGRLELSATPHTQNGLTIRNLHQERMAGNFSLYYDQADDTRHFVASWALDLGAAGANDDFANVNVVLPDDAGRADLTLVFRGGIGNGDPIDEPDAVTAKVTALPFFLVGSDSVGGQIVTARSQLVDRGWSVRGVSPNLGFGAIFSGGTFVNDWLSFVSTDYGVFRILNGGESVESFDAPSPLFSFSITAVGPSTLLRSYFDVSGMTPQNLEFTGSGTLMTNDIGESWILQPHGLARYATSNATGIAQSIAYIGSDKVLLACPGPADTRGLYLSDDRGTSWQSVSDLIVDGLPVGGCTTDPSFPYGLPIGPFIHGFFPNCRDFFRIDGFAWNHIEGPGSAVLAWAERAHNAQPGGGDYHNGLWLSKDGGHTWFEIPSPENSDSFGLGTFWISAAMAPSGEVIGTFSVYSSGSFDVHMVKTADRGQSWENALVPVGWCTGCPQSFVYLGVSGPWPE